MLHLSGVALRRGHKLLFENVSFQVHAGQRLGLVGANGSGKTSLFSALLGELETDAGEIQIPTAARIAHVAQQSPSGARSALDFVMDGDRELRELQRLIVAADASGDESAAHELYERLEIIDGYTAEARAARLLNGLGFREDDNRKPVDSFSGGWRMRLSLAQALMCRSDMLLLDEPTNHLDLPAILWLESWLQRYPGILLLISHDRDFIDAVCTRIGLIDNREIRLYSGNYSDFEKQRAEQLALQGALHKRQQAEMRHIQSYIDRFRYKASKARQAQSRLKMLERMTLIAPAHVDSPFDFHFLQPPRQPRHLARLEGVSAGYAEPVLDGVELLISASDRFGLLGVNGAGKSTLVKALADGSTVLGGRRTLSRDTRIGYFAQHQLDALVPERSPLDHVRRLSPDARESELRRYLGGFGFSGERVSDPVAPFSGGEKARLVLALLIRQQPNLLLLDEPTNHLDLEMRQALSRALMEFAGAIVLISHDRHLLRSVCDELFVVHGGRVDRFNQALDDYPAWLAEQRTAEQQRNGSRSAPRRAQDVTAPNAPTAPVAQSRKLQRQLDAKRRLALKPLTDRVREIEENLASYRRRIASLESRLADPELYSDPLRKPDMTELVREEAALRREIAVLEALWLDTAGALERARDERGPES